MTQERFEARHSKLAELFNDPIFQRDRALEIRATRFLPGRRLKKRIAKKVLQHWARYPTAMRQRALKTLFHINNQLSRKWFKALTPEDQEAFLNERQGQWMAPLAGSAIPLLTHYTTCYAIAMAPEPNVEPS